MNQPLLAGRATIRGIYKRKELNMKLLRMLLDRLDEPTSWAAIGAMLALFGINVDAELWGATVNAAIAISGLLLVIIPTKDVERRVSDAVARKLPERLRDAGELPSEAEADPARRVANLEDIYGGFEVE
jgi:hypothetical protein